MLRRLKRGQSTMEYAIVIGLVIAAAVGMQIYVKRGLQGKIRDATNIQATGATWMTGAQYEPNYSAITGMQQTRTATETAETKTGGGIVRTTVGQDVSRRQGGEQITYAP